MSSIDDHEPQFVPFDFDESREYEIVANNGPVSVFVQKDRGITWTKEQTELFCQAGNRAYEIATKIIGAEELATIVPPQINLRISDDMGTALMQTSMYTNPAILKMSGDTMVGAILHELLESYRDPTYCNEGPHLLAEYLFCGQDRLGLFLQLSNDFWTLPSQAMDNHVSGWGNICLAVYDEIRQRPEIELDDFVQITQDMVDSFMETLRIIPEEEKINVIKRYLKWNNYSDAGQD